MKQVLIKKKTVLESQPNHLHRHEAWAQVVAGGTQASGGSAGRDAEPPRGLGTGEERPVEVTPGTRPFALKYQKPRTRAEDAATGAVPSAQLYLRDVGDTISARNTQSKEQREPLGRSWSKPFTQSRSGATEPWPTEVLLSQS